MSSPLSLPMINRRRLLVGLAMAPTALVPSFPAFASVVATSRAHLVPTCVLTPQLEEGPFYFDPKLVRQDLAQDCVGVPLALRLIVVEAGSCRSVQDARVDIWSADANGVYSGYHQHGDDGDLDTSGKTFLRGTQFTNEYGEVLFQTLYPGWYSGRTTHIHYKIFLNQRTVLCGQLFFPDALSEYIYANVNPYNRRTVKRDAFNSDDHVAAMDKAHTAFCDIKEEPNRYLATLILGVDRSAIAPAAENHGPRPFGLGMGQPTGPRPDGVRSDKSPVIVPGIKP